MERFQMTVDSISYDGIHKNSVDIEVSTDASESPPTVDLEVWLNGESDDYGCISLTDSQAMDLAGALVRAANQARKSGE